jgi:putative peptidoglycan lipid II flippase
MPMKTAFICLGVSVLFRTVLIFPLMHGGLALATSLSSTLNLILLCRELGPKLGGIDIRKNIQSLLRILLCSLPMGLAAYGVCTIGTWSTTGNVGEKTLILFSGIVIGLGIYLACSYWVKNEEMLFLLKMVKEQMKRQEAYRIGSR